MRRAHYDKARKETALQDADINNIVERALGIQSLSSRHDFLDEACNGDEALRLLVEKAVLEREIAAATAELDAFDDQLGNEKPGDAIGNFRLIRRIGQGGFGVVWMAHQEKPVRRHVALKIIKVGMDTKQVVARFEQERQALAMMDHPHIANVLDAGATSTGRPFFAMELVSGIPVNEYCDGKKLTIAERLAVVEQVCSAIAHAHGKGVIHRDIKPSNILVGEHDGQPHATIIDFGIAKAASEKLIDATLLTEQNTIIGTLAYMSPEQAAGSTSLDIRTDIYSLGVVIYELLTGAPPFNAHALAYELQRLIREVDPSPPSLRAVEDEDTRERVASCRQIDSKKLSRAIAGELDWIVMRAMDKDPSRRYSTADALLADLKRYRMGEPIEAAPPSKSYRIRKFVKRHRVAVAAAVMVSLSLISGIIGTTLAMVEAREQRATSEKRLGQVKKANEILGSVFSSLDPLEVRAGDRPLTAIIADMLDAAVKELDGETIGDPEVVAGMQGIFGKSLVGLLAPEKAIVVLDRAASTYERILGPLAHETLMIQNNLAVAYQDAHRYDDATRLLEMVWRATEQAQGRDSRDTLMCQSNYALALVRAGKPDAALPILVDLRGGAKRVLNPCDPFVTNFSINYAAALGRAGRIDDAIAVYHEILAAMDGCGVSANEPQRFGTVNNLAQLLIQSKQYEAALKLLVDVVPKARQRFGVADSRTIAGLSSLGTAQVELGRLDEARQTLEEAYRACVMKFGRDNETTLSLALDLCGVASAQGDLAVRNRVLVECLPSMQKLFGVDDPRTLVAEFTVLLANTDQKDMRAALPRLDGIWKRMLKHPADLDRAQIGLDLATEYLRSADSVNALGVLDAIGDLTPLFTNDPTSALQASLRVGYLAASCGGTKQATKVLAWLDAWRTNAATPSDDLDWAYISGTADLLLDMGRYFGAADRWAKARELALAKFGPKDRRSVLSLLSVARVKTHEGDVEATRVYFTEGLPLAREILGNRDPKTVEAIAQLGICHFRQGRPKEAEPLLLEAARLYDALDMSDHELARMAWSNLAGLAWGKGEYSKAIELFEDVLKRTSRAVGADSADAVFVQANLIVNYAAAKRWNDVIATAEVCLPRLVMRADVSFALGDIVRAYGLSADSARFEVVLGDILKSVRRFNAPSSRELANAFVAMGTTLLELGRFADAEKVLREVVAIRAAVIPNEWLTYNSRSMLGGALMGQSKFDAAGPLLLEGYKGLKERILTSEDAIRVRLLQAADRIVMFYELTKVPDQLAIWKAERASLNR